MCFARLVFLLPGLLSFKQLRLHLFLVKTKVAKLKTFSIPKMELQAPLLASRLKEDLLGHFQLMSPAPFCRPIARRCYNGITLSLNYRLWSQTVFVKLKNSPLWIYGNSRGNPAATGTRGISLECLKESSWVRRPSIVLAMSSLSNQIWMLLVKSSRRNLWTTP